MMVHFKELFHYPIFSIFQYYLYFLLLLINLRNHFICFHINNDLVNYRFPCLIQSHQKEIIAFSSVNYIMYFNTSYPF